MEKGHDDCKMLLARNFVNVSSSATGTFLSITNNPTKPSPRFDKDRALELRYQPCCENREDESKVDESSSATDVVF